MSRKILPEACYNIKEEMNFNGCIKAYKENETVYGKIINYDLQNKHLIVKLGSNCFATLPFNEVTIYPLKYSSNHEYKLPLQVYYLLHKRIAAKILDIYENEIILSRKNNMLESFQQLQNSSYLSFYVTKVDRNEVFGDVGDGIVARIPIYELCRARIRSAFEVISKNSLITTKVLSYDEENYRFNVSYKESFDKYNPTLYNKGDVVACTVNEFVDDEYTGYFANVSPQVVGIIDNRYWMPKLSYGDKVECIITNASKKGLHLKFICYSY